MHYDTRNTGTLWLETEPKSERSPNFTGKLDVEGKEYRIVGWNKTTNNGKDLISLAISEPEPRDTQKWDETREKFAVKKDVVLEDIDDGPIDLSEIPF